MNQDFFDNHYLIIRKFISPKRAKKLAKEFIEYCQKNNLDSDSQVPNTPKKYNYISFLELLCEKTPEVSKIIGETVLPSYCYSRLYKHGDVLDKHTDRDPCEISFTIHLDGDKKWPIYIENKKGEEIEVILNSGDALLYLGCDAPHWRNSFEGNFYSQLFTHYVRSRGNRAYAYFDKKNKNIFKDNNLLKTNNNNNLEVNSNTKLSDLIQVFENLIPEELCDEIICEYAADDEWQYSEISKNNERKKDFEIRNCKILSISDFNNQKNTLTRKNIDSKIFNLTKTIVIDISEKFLNFSITGDSGFELLKYEVGGFYTQHVDSFSDSKVTRGRLFSCSIILNDDYEGGEFAFFDRELKYKLKKGSAIVFPSNYLFPHEIMPVTSGTRYSIITWFL